MKLLLRYQISGMIFIFWGIIFYFGKDASNLKELIDLIIKDNNSNISVKSIVSLLSALPIGVILHQISVMIKNWVIGRFISEFNDLPKEKIINSSLKMTTYILDRISNLNSFYYVRFDNGILAPLMAYLVIIFVMERSINSIWIYSAVGIGTILSIYIYRIREEIKIYNEMLISAGMSSHENRGN